MLELAVPIVLAEIGWMSMGIVDTIMVGRLPSSAVAIGAVALGQGLFYTVGIFGSGLLLGLDTVVSHAYGRGDLEDANQSLITSLWFAAGLTPLLMAMVSLWPPLMRHLGISHDILEQMSPFLSALNWSMFPLLLYFALRRYLQAVDLVAPVAFALISANLVNLLGNWVFIYGHLGMPAFGVRGSGWSTCIARVYMALVLLAAVVVFNRRRQLHLWSGNRPSLARLRRLVSLGLPAATQILLEVGVFSATTALVGKMGAIPLSGHQIALMCAAFTYMVPLGLSSAAAVRVGQALGRNDPGAARRAGWTAIALGAAFMTFASLIFISVPQWIARIFTPDAAVMRMGARLLLIAAAFQLFDGLQTVATGTLRGLGDTRTPVLANFLAYWVIGLPLGALLGFKFGWGAAGLWTGLCVGLILIAVSLVFVWQRSIAHIAARAATATAGNG